MEYNTSMQYYKGVPLKLIVYTDKHFARLRAKRFTINNTNQNLWIPNKHLAPDGTILPDQDLDYILRQSRNQIRIAGANFPL